MKQSILRNCMAGLCCWLALASVTISAQDKGLRTNGLQNGRLWAYYTYAEKLAYIIGVSEHRYIVTESLVESEKRLEREMVIPQGVTFTEVAKAVDHFYADPINARVPVVMGVSYVGMAMRGASSELLSSYLSRIRRWASTPDSDGK